MTIALLLFLFDPVGAASAKPVLIERETKALDFSYQWSAEAAAIPSLNARLKTKAAAALKDAQKMAREDEVMARSDERPFNKHYLAVGWDTAGQSPQLLSLEGTIESFTGGAHPNHEFSALLWDRTANREIAATALFASGASLERLTRRSYCRALDAERLKRREGERLGGDFDACPQLHELAIVPADADGNGRFEALKFVAAPYVAGPYAEGEYEVSVAVTPRLIGALKPAYRSAFEVQRQ
ncbi:MAG TPA: DUF4163 domain-containing protein [Sphingomicrobium sp.]|jgi:hypothetical protein